MDDKSALLNQLRIERGAADDGRGSSWRWPALGLLAAAGIALGAWLWFHPAAVPVHAATARAAAAGGTGAAGSVLDASGYVVARRQATVASKITAKMIELDIEEGQHVDAGQIIARLDATNIQAAFDQARAQLDYAKAALTETQVNLANAQRDYDRQIRLLADHFVSQAAVDAAQTALDALRAQLTTQRTNVEVVARGLNVAERNLDDTIVRAPFAGVVTVKAAQPGEMVSPISAGGGFTRTGIGTIVDMDSLEVQVDVNENFINRVKPAQRAAAKLNAYPDWEIPAHVVAVIPTADRSKGTVTVRIALDQKDPRILPEMGVRVAFLPDRPEVGAAAPAGVLVPDGAVQGAGAAGVVFVIRDGTIERRAVRLGPAAGNEITVIAGVTAGERIAVGDLSRLEDGARIRIE